jgi:hypothetical protein
MIPKVTFCVSFTFRLRWARWCVHSLASSGLAAIAKRFAWVVSGAMGIYLFRVGERVEGLLMKVVWKLYSRGTKVFHAQLRLRVALSQVLISLFL